ncbi:alpha/beta hydrolase [Nocardia sp. NPDC058519]|uniref:alpha/beta hydrolase n=1 Tax=Nocardia sp. NPDC058519 TaxID=3346535 RepID=UPI00365EABC4
MTTDLHFHSTASRRATLLYVLARVILKPFYRIWPLNDHGLRALRLIDTTLGLLPYAKTVSLERSSLGGVVVETSAGPTTAIDTLTDATVLYLHGGGFVFCGLATHRRVCGSLALSLGVPVHSVDYRQLPQAGVGTSVRDAYDAYRALLGVAPDPDKVILIGDSAGGFLAAKICELAHRDGITTPAAFVGYSPQLTLDLDRIDPALLRGDAYQPISAVRRAAKRWSSGPVLLEGTASPADDIAPVAFPPTFLTGVARELLEPDIRTLTGRLSAADRTVETHVWRRGVHAFPVLDTLLPESRHALRLTGEFLRRVLAPEADNETDQLSMHG